MLKQHSDHDCYLTCAANATGVDYEEVFPAAFREKVDRNPGVSGDMIDQVWAYCGLEGGIDYWDFHIGYGVFNYGFLQKILNGRRAVLTVPSLNNPPPGLHAVYWDGHSLHDPSTKKTYTYLEQCYPQRLVIFNERPKKNENPDLQ